LALVLGACAAHAARQNFSALVCKAAEPVYIFIVDILDFFYAKRAYLAALFSAPGPASAFASLYSILSHAASLQNY
jgi:hypothetical protein